MKKILALVMILAIVALCVFAALKAGDKDVDNNVVDLETDATTITVATTVTDADGKIYYVGPTDYDAYQLALEGGLQERIDATIMSEFMVYDIVREGDSTLVDADGKEINLCYGISSQAMPEEVTILRDGFAVFTWDEEEFEVSDKTDKVFVGAADSKFTARVFCEEHKAIWARERIGYPEALEWAEGNKKGLRGPFDLDLLDDELFEAFVLVQRGVSIDGENQNAYTWVVRICDCNQPEDSTPSEPVTEAPTQAPTPTDAPTQAPTPTDAPTQAPTPTDAPTQAPTPTDAPTQAPTPTDAPTQAPSATDAPDYEPTGTPPPVVTQSPDYEPVGTPPTKVTATPVASEETFKPEYSETQDAPPAKVTVAPVVTTSTETFETEESNESSVVETNDVSKSDSQVEVTQSNEIFTPEYSEVGNIPAKVN